MTERLAPLAPSPRSETPCVVGFAFRLDERRNIENPTVCRSTSSSTGAADEAMSAFPSVATLAGVSPIRVSVRLAVTMTSSRI